MWEGQNQVEDVVDTGELGCLGVKSDSLVIFENERSSGSFGLE